MGASSMYLISRVGAMWVPECTIANPTYMEPIEGLAQIPKNRYKSSCYLCQKKYGVPIHCSHRHCNQSFHPSCGRVARLYMKMRDQFDGSSFRAYCDKHTPPEYRECIDMDLAVANAQYELSFIKVPETSRKSLKPENRKSNSKAPETLKRKSKSVIESSDEDELEEPGRIAYSLASPVIPNYIFKRVMSTLEPHFITKKNELLIQVAKYWALKREARRGAALLKRLHLEPWTVSASANHEDEEKKAKRYQTLSLLRRDLERVRMLADSVRKREREKLQFVKRIADNFFSYVHPFNHFCSLILQDLNKLDRQGFFSDPVNAEDVPDYYDIVLNPIDFSIISNKVKSYQYSSLDHFKEDVILLVNNCLIYNKADTPYAKVALAIHDAIEKLIPIAKTQLEPLMDPKTGFSKAPFSFDLFQ